MQTNEKVISDFAQARMVKALAMFHILKKKQSHGIIWGYTPKKVADLTGLSEKTVRKYVQFLTQYSFYNLDRIKTERKVAELWNGNLILHSIQPRKRLCTIRFDESYSIEEVEALLYGKIIAEFKRQQRGNIRKKREDKRLLENPQNAKEARNRSKIIKETGTLENGEVKTVYPETYVIKTSVNLLSSKCGISKRKFREVVKTLKRKKIVRVKDRIVPIMEMNRTEFYRWKEHLTEKYGYCYWYCGRVMNNQTRMYYFADYPERRRRSKKVEQGINSTKV